MHNHLTAGQQGNLDNGGGTEWAFSHLHLHSNHPDHRQWLFATIIYRLSNHGKGNQDRRICWAQNKAYFRKYCFPNLHWITAAGIRLMDTVSSTLTTNRKMLIWLLLIFARRQSRWLCVPASLLLPQLNSFEGWKWGEGAAAVGNLPRYLSSSPTHHLVTSESESESESG